MCTTSTILPELVELKPTKKRAPSRWEKGKERVLFDPLDGDGEEGTEEIFLPNNGGSINVHRASTPTSTISELKLHGFNDRFSRWNFLKKDHFVWEPERWEAVMATLLQKNEEVLFTEARGSKHSLASRMPLVTVYALFSLFLIPCEIYLLASPLPDRPRLGLHLLYLWVLVSLIIAAHVFPQVMQRVCYVLTTQKALIVYDSRGLLTRERQIQAFGCEYGQMNMIGMTASYHDGSGSVLFRRDPFASRGFWPFSTKSLSHSEWGFPSVAKPELVESIIMDVSAITASQASFHCQIFDTPPRLITISRVQEVLSILQLYIAFPLLLLWALFLHPLFAITLFLSFLLIGLLGLHQFNLLSHKDLNPGLCYSYILLVVISGSICLLDLLDAAGYLPLTMPEDDLPLIEDLLVRVGMDFGTLTFLCLALAVGVMNTRGLLDHMRQLHVATLTP